MTTPFPSFDYYICKNCKIDIGSVMSELHKNLRLSDSGLGSLSGFIERGISNVIIRDGEKELREAGPHRVADVHCAGCLDHIGYKYIAGPPDKESIIFEEDFLMIKEKLEFSDRSHESAEMAEMEAFIERIVGKDAGTDGHQPEQAEAEGQEQDAGLIEQNHTEAGDKQEEAPAETERQGQETEMGQQDQTAAEANKRKPLQEQRDNSKMQKRESGSSCSSRPRDT